MSVIPAIIFLIYFQTTQDDNDDDENPDSEMRFISQESKGQSRILNEFEMLKFLGKGAFGDVLKVIQFLLFFMCFCFSMKY